MASKVTWAAITTVITGLGTMTYIGCNKAIELDEKLERREAVMDSLFANDSLLFKDIKLIKKALGIKGSVILKKQTKRKGLLFKGWDLLFGRG